MSERASHSPITTRQRLQLPLNGTLYTTTRAVSAEKPLPVVGGTMEAELGAFYAASRVIAVDRQPNQHDALVIQHVIIPSETEQLLSNWEETSIDIGGKTYPAVIRTVIMLAADYSSSSPAARSAMPIGSDNRFHNLGYVLWDRDCVKTGLPLEPVFRVDRRTYIIPQTVAGETFAPDGVLVASTGAVVADTATTDRGVNIIQSEVTPAGNGNATKNTSTAKKRTIADIIETGHPKQQVKTSGTDTEVPARYADQVSSIDETIQLELDAASVDDIPQPDPPTGDVAQVIHKKINDWRYEKTTRRKQFSLDTSLEDVDIDVRPYVTITRRSVGSQSPQLPATGSGSSRLVYKGGSVKIYDNTNVDSSARTGNKSVEDNGQAWGSYTEQTDYTTDSSAPEGGSTRLIYDDGQTKVYEASRITGITVNGTTKDKDPKEWGFSTWNGVYSDSEDVGADRSKQIWRKGAFRVYLNETVATEVSGTTLDKDPQQWGTLNWDGTYSDTQDAAADKTRQVWRIGDKRVFLNETARAEVIGGTVDIDPQAWGSLRWDGAYGTSVSGDRSRQVWRMGDRVVFLNETLSVELEGSTQDLDPQQWGSLVWTGSYATTPSGDRYRQIWKLKGNTVFLNENVTVEVSGTTLDKDPQPWGTVQWDGTYASSATDADRNRQVWRIGAHYVYLNETATLTIEGTTLDKDLREWGEIHWVGIYGSTSSGDRSRQVYNLHGKQVFLNENVTVENVGGTNKEVLPQEWGSLVWDGEYSTEPDEAVGHRSRQVFRVKGFTVYLNETPSEQINAAEFLSAREDNSVLIEYQYSSYSTSAANGTNTRSEVVFSLGDIRVYRNVRITRSAKSPKTYPGLAMSVDLPPILRDINTFVFPRRDGLDEYAFQPSLTNGYRGSLPCTITEYWAENPSASAGVVVMRPEPVAFDTPLGGVSIPASLHGPLQFTVNIGTDHPVYEQQFHTVIIGATTPPTWEGQILLVDVDAQPYREGYIIREYRIET